MANNSLNNECKNDFTITGGVSGSSRILRVENNYNTASSSAVIETQVGGTSADDTYFRYVMSTTSSWALGIDNSDSQSFNLSYAASASATPSSTKSILAMTSGELLYPNQPIFKAYVSSTIYNVTGDGTVYGPIPFDTEKVDQNSNYDNSTNYRFTAPKDGKYLLSFCVIFGDLDSSNSGTDVYMYKNATDKISAYMFSISQLADSSGEAGVSGVAIVNLAASD